MSFKLLLLFFVVSCGVKGDPMIPVNKSMPSLIENYPDINPNRPIEDVAPTKKK